MNKNALQLALREWKAEFSRPVTWGVLVAVGLVLSVAGAFDTDQVLRPVPLGLYWISVTSMTYAVGSLLSGIIRHSLQDQPRILRLAVMAFASGCVLTVLILGMNTALFGWFFQTKLELVGFIVSVFGVVIIVTLALDWALTHAAQKTQDGLKPHGPALLERLPIEKRGEVVSLSALDHYVEVKTTTCKDLVLIRLSDAIREMDPVVGVQIHRSHWVALSHIAKVTKQGAQTVLETSDGRSLPVSRSGVPRLKEHGVLPR